jgi:hypothetical protein
MTARTVFEAAVVTAHNTAVFGGVTPNTGATVAPAGNMTTWSRASAESARAAGTITQSQYVSVMNYLATWEETQIGNARPRYAGPAISRPPEEIFTWFSVDFARSNKQ